MAQPETTRFGKFKVLLGNGASPEVFASPCGFTQRAFNRSKELTDSVVPDCDDEDKPAWTGRDVRSLSASISGSGVLAKSALPLWEDAFEGIEPTSVKVVFVWKNDETTTYTGKMHVSSLEISADLGDKVQISVSMESDGPLERTESP